MVKRRKRILVLLLLSLILQSAVFFALPEEILAQPMPEGYDEESFAAAKLRGVQGMTDEEKMRDYDVFWEIIEKSYPMYDYLKRYGVQFDLLKEQYRAGVYSLYDNVSWQNYFYYLISQITLPEPEAGHLGLVLTNNSYIRTYYQSYHYLLEEEPEDDWIDMMSTIFANPHVLGFYGLEKEERKPGDPAPFVDVPDNLYIQYNEYYNYAYVKINSFMNENEEDDEILREFFTRAESLAIDHVIIDIRGNLGGYNDYWLKNIVAPNIEEPMSVENFGLYKDSEWSRPCLDYYDGSAFVQGAESEEEENNSSADKTSDGQDPKEAGEEGDKPEEVDYTVLIYWERTDQDLPDMENLIESDVENLDAVFLETLSVRPSEENPLFTGKFWLLSDAQSYSASEYFISFAKRTGFADIVGSKSGGDGSCVITLYNALPESGLLIRYNALYGLNPDGSSTEEDATLPDYELLPGEDAFTKVLQLIAEADLSGP